MLEGCEFRDMRITRKITVGIFLADPANNVKVIWRKSKFPSLPKVSRRKREEEGQRNDQPEIGRCKKEVIVPVYLGNRKRGGN